MQERDEESPEKFKKNISVAEGLEEKVRTEMKKENFLVSVKKKCIRNINSS